MPERALIEKYEMTLGDFTLKFTMVMDGSAVMAKVANASVSRDLHIPDATWMIFQAHQINNSVKAAMASYYQTDVPQVVVQDFGR